MSVINCVKHFFAQTISGYGKVMKERNPDWCVVAKTMMSDLRLFNAEICELDGDNKNQSHTTNVLNTCSMKENSSSVASLQCVDSSNQKADHSFLYWESTAQDDLISVNLN